MPQGLVDRFALGHPIAPETDFPDVDKRADRGLERAVRISGYALGLLGKFGNPAVDFRPQARTPVDFGKRTGAVHGKERFVVLDSVRQTRLEFFGRGRIGRDHTCRNERTHGKPAVLRLVKNILVGNRRVRGKSRKGAQRQRQGARKERCARGGGNG